MRAQASSGTLDAVDSPDHLAAEAARACAGLLRAAERLGRELDAELRARHRIGLRALDLLSRLADEPTGGCVRLTALAADGALSQSRVSRLVAELEGRGLVSRAACAADGRGIEVAATEAGVRALRAARETHRAEVARLLLARLAPEDVAALARITAGLLDQEPAPTGAPAPAS